MREGLATFAAAAVLLGAASADAWAHGGNFPPHGPPPRAPTGTPGGGGPGGGGGGRATTGGGALVSPDPAETAVEVGADDWRRWWHANRQEAAPPVARAVTPGAADDPGAPSDRDRERAFAALLAVVADPNDDLASGALVALGRMGDGRAEDVLVRTASDGKRSQEVREAAVLGLAILPESLDADAVRALLESVLAGRTAKPRLRAFAASALGLRRERASSALLGTAAVDPDEDLQVAAASLSALGMIGGEEARATLAEVLGRVPRDDAHGEARTRRVFAAHGLAKTGDPASAAALREAATDDDPAVRRACALALGVLAGPDDRDSARVLETMLRRDADAGARNFAALSLGRCGAPSANAHLSEAWERGKLCDRAFAALGLACLARGAGDPRILAAPLSELPRAAAAGSAAPGAPRTPPELRGALAVAAAIAEARSALPALRAVADARAEDVWLRIHAVSALGVLRDREAAPMLREFVDQVRAPSLQREAATALGLAGDLEAVPVLHRHLLASPSLFVRGASAVALGRIGGPTAARVLAETLADETKPGIVRAMAAVGLGRLLDRGRSLSPVAADLDPRSATDAVDEILTIL